jgi:hypothetical protein
VIKKVIKSFIQPAPVVDTKLIKDGPYWSHWTSMENSLELIDRASIQ